MNKTRMLDTKKLDSKWYFLDATDKVLGRIATEITVLLLGKNDPAYTPGVFFNNHVVVINAEKVKTTGKKLTDKVYYRHSNYPGGLKAEVLGDLLQDKPTRPIEYAVSGMLPTTKLRKAYLANLHVYAGSEHPHQAQEVKK